MDVFKTQAKVGDDGSIQVFGLPFAPGQPVELIVKPLAAKPTPGDSETERYPLRGLINESNYHYHFPFEPANLEDWESCLEVIDPGNTESSAPDNG